METKFTPCLTALEPRENPSAVTPGPQPEPPPPPPPNQAEVGWCLVLRPTPNPER